MAGSDARRDRLAAALRENLKKRKARARAAAPAMSDETPTDQPIDCAAKAPPPRRSNAVAKRD
jgi:hypothetical protein